MDTKGMANSIPTQRARQPKIMMPMLISQSTNELPQFPFVIRDATDSCCLIVPAILMILGILAVFTNVIIDRKAGVIESFSVASRITNGNWGSSFVLWLMSMGIMILGCLALCVECCLPCPWYP